MPQLPATVSSKPFGSSSFGHGENEQKFGRRALLLTAAPVAVVAGLAWLMTLAMTWTSASAAKSGLNSQNASGYGMENIDGGTSTHRANEEAGVSSGAPLSGNTYSFVEQAKQGKKEPTVAEMEGDVLVVVLATDSLLQLPNSSSLGILRGELDTLTKNYKRRLLGGDVWLCGPDRMMPWSSHLAHPAAWSEGSGQLFEGRWLRRACDRVENDAVVAKARDRGVQVIVVWYCPYKPTPSDVPRLERPLEISFVWAGISAAQQNKLSHVTDLFRCTYPQENLGGLAVTIEQAIHDGDSLAH